MSSARRYAGSAGAIRVTAIREGERVVVSISDSGPGVPDEALEHLFSPFYRLEADPCYWRSGFRPSHSQDLRGGLRWKRSSA